MNQGMGLSSSGQPALNSSSPRPQAEKDQSQHLHPEFLSRALEYKAVVLFLSYSHSKAALYCNRAQVHLA